MKNTLRKTLLICFGFAFLGGLYSFKILAKEDSTIIKEVIIESNLCGCNCDLYVETSAGWWYLKLKNGCPDPVDVTCYYIIRYADGDECKHTYSARLGGYQETVVETGNLRNSECKPNGVKARYVN